MRHPLSRLFLASILLASAPLFAHAKDDGGDIDGGGPKKEIHLDPIEKPRRDSSSTNPTPTPTPGKPVVILPVGNQPVADKPDPKTPDPVATIPPADDQTGFPTPNPIKDQPNNNNGTLAPVSGKIIGARDTDGKNLQAPRVNASLDKKKLEDRLAPLMQKTQDPGALAENGGAVLATPVSWPSAASNQFATQNAARTQIPLDSMLRARDYSAAEKALNEQLAANPKDEAALRLRAITQRLEKKFDGALADADKAIALDPKDGWARNVRALTLNDLKRYDEAVAEAGRSINLNPKDAGALAARAAAFRGLGRRAERLADLKQAASLDSQFADLYRRALSDDDTAAPVEKPATNGSSWLLYASGIGGLLFILVAVWLLYLRTGHTVSGPRPAMRMAERILPASQPVVQGFDITRKIGEGGMGIVFEALDRGLHRKVALKQLRADIASDPRERKRFLREASIVAALHHPHIVSIHSVFESDGGLYLVFELINGDSLSRVLSTQGAFAPMEVVRLLKPVADALDYAHGRGVLHRDLKPANIMVEVAGAKIMDFGISRRDTDTATPAGTTTRNEIVGTPPYMAPEQELGQPVPASDLYALGVSAYEMLAGRRPFASNHGLMDKLEARFQPVSQVKPGLPVSLDAVLAKALAGKPEARYPSSRDFLADLEKALS